MKFVTFFGIFCLTCAVKHKLSSSITSFQDEIISRPQVMCRKSQKSADSECLLLSWSCRNVECLSALFFVELRNSSSGWKYLGWTKKNFLEIMDLQFTFSYQFRVMPFLSADNAVFPITSKWIELQGISSSLSAPSDAQVSDFTIERRRVNAVVRWTASKELPCSYEVFWFLSLRNDNITMSQKVTLPHNDLSVSVLGLLFNMNYTIRITPFSEDERGKSESSETWFLTPTCLALTGNNSNFCDTTSAFNHPALSASSLSLVICGAVLLSVMIFMILFSKLFKKKPKFVGYPSGVADVQDSMLPFLVSADRIRLTAVLGRGAFGVVHRGMFMRGSKKTEEVVAVKVLPSDSNTRRQLLYEVEMMQIVGRHEKVVGLIGFSLDIEKTFLILEYCPMGDLHSYLLKKKPELLRMKSLPSITPLEYSKMSTKKLHLGKRLCLYINQVAEGMEYIANLKLIHRDVAARNILMVDKDRVKIADFGLSRDVYETRYYLSSSEAQQKKLPIKWMAPEAIENQKFSTHSDVWSFGIFMWEVFRFGKEPYPGLSNSRVLDFLKNGYRLEWPNCRLEWYDLMLECWHDNPRKRPPFKELVKRIMGIIDTMYHYAVFF